MPSRKCVIHQSRHSAARKVLLELWQAFTATRGCSATAVRISRCVSHGSSRSIPRANDTGLASAARIVASFSDWAVVRGITRSILKQWYDLAVCLFVAFNAGGYFAHQRDRDGAAVLSTNFHLRRTVEPEQFCFAFLDLDQCVQCSDRIGLCRLPGLKSHSLKAFDHRLPSFLGGLLGYPK